MSGSKELATLRRSLRSQASKERAAASTRFFKTGPGQYGEGDLFLGIKVPDIRSSVRLCGRELTTADAMALLRSKYHEERLAALLILVYQFGRTSLAGQKEIYQIYLRNTEWINNWDLVDLSAEHIIGAYLHQRSKRPLYRLARSRDLWERRIAIIATFHYIKRGEYTETFTVANMLLNDEHDLIHKAVGWMLREVGKRCGVPTLEHYLMPRYRKIPRTMLRYAIERLPEPTRQAYLKGKVPDSA